MAREEISTLFRICLQSNTLSDKSSEKCFTQYATALSFVVFKNVAFEWTKLCKT